MKNYLIALTLITLVFGVSSCDNELDVTAPYKEIPIIYGLLNRNDTVHYIKINKAYLNEEGSALLAASIPDSVYFPENLLVTLEEYDGSTKKRTFTLDTVSIPKEEGTFGGPNNLLYRTPGSVTLIQTYNYKLVVAKASNLQVIARSACKIVNDFGYAPPNVFECSFVDNKGYKDQAVQWSSAVNAKMYDLVLRFNFQEINTTTSDTVVKFIDMPLLNKYQVSSTAGGEKITVTIDGENFFLNIQDAIDPLPSNYIRKMLGNLEFRFSVAGEDLTRYIQFNLPSTSLNEVRPEYTNIENGFGVFSTRYNKSFTNLGLNLLSINELKTGGITGDLNFQ
jgi:hypothetical protein